MIVFCPPIMFAFKPQWFLLVYSIHIYTVKMNMLYLINRIVATDYEQYYSLNLTN